MGRPSHRRVLQPRRKRRKTSAAKEVEEAETDLHAEYAKIARRMLDKGNLMLCTAFFKSGDPPGVWFYDSTFWHHPLCPTQSDG